MVVSVRQLLLSCCQSHQPTHLSPALHPIHTSVPTETSMYGNFFKFNCTSESERHDVNRSSFDNIRRTVNLDFWMCVDRTPSSVSANRGPPIWPSKKQQKEHPTALFYKSLKGRLGSAWIRLGRNLPCDTLGNTSRPRWRHHKHLCDCTQGRSQVHTTPSQQLQTIFLAFSVSLPQR